MIFILIGGFLVALSAAALAALPFRLARRPVPRSVPVLAGGLALFAFVIWNDYSWYQRTRAELPERVSVISTLTYSDPVQPWTLVVPRVDRFTAIDRASIRRNADLPDFAIAEVLFVQRYQPTLRARQIFDCARMRRADLTDRTQFGDDGMPQDVVWVELDENDPMIVTVCQENQSTD